MLDERYREPLVELLCELVRIPSRSTPEGGEEGAIQRDIAQRMRDLGADVRAFEAADYPQFFSHPLCSEPNRQYDDRPTVVGQIGPENAPALLVLAHSDTVPIFEPDQWTFDPFLGEVRHGAVLGLGTTDDKWGIATILTILRALRDSGRTLKKRLILASTMDEENGVGNGTLLLTLAGIQAESALYLDGYQMRICIGNLGGSSYYLRPKTAMSADDLAPHTERLRRACAAMSLRRAPLFDRPFFRDNSQVQQSLIPYLRHDERGWHFNLGFYTLPGEDPDVFRAEMEQEVSSALGDDAHLFDTSYRQPWFDATLVPDDTPLIGHVANAVRHVLECDPVVTTISKQDCFVLNRYASIPTVSFGPTSRIAGRGAFHGPDESLAIDELWAGCSVTYDAICRWLES